MFSGEKPAELHLEQTGGVLSLQLLGNCHNLFQSIKIFKILLSKELSAQWKIYRLKHLTKFVTTLSRPCMGSHSGSTVCELPLPGRLLKSSNRNYWKSTMCSTKFKLVVVEKYLKTFTSEASIIFIFSSYKLNSWLISGWSKKSSSCSKNILCWTSK